jgi:hypothetical protein
MAGTARFDIELLLSREREHKDLGMTKATVHEIPRGC